MPMSYLSDTVQYDPVQYETFGKIGMIQKLLILLNIKIYMNWDLKSKQLYMSSMWINMQQDGDYLLHIERVSFLR